MVVRGANIKLPSDIIQSEKEVIIDIPLSSLSLEGEGQGEGDKLILFMLSVISNFPVGARLAVPRAPAEPRGYLLLLR